MLVEVLCVCGGFVCLFLEVLCVCLEVLFVCGGFVCLWGFLCICGGLMCLFFRGFVRVSRGFVFVVVVCPPQRDLGLF